MKFQKGDHVLWEGGIVRVKWVLDKQVCVAEENGFKWVFLAEALASHQRPWSFDKNLGWVPA